jgi:flagella basal body P-ring formation protein FlgA
MMRATLVAVIALTLAGAAVAAPVAAGRHSGNHTIMAVVPRSAPPQLPPARYAAAAAPAVPVKAGPATALVTLKPTAEVKGRNILLGDVANIETTDPTLLESLQAIEVGVAPTFGGTRQVSAQYVKARVQQLGIDLKLVTLDGPLLTTVTRPEQILSGSAMEHAVCEAVEKDNPGVSAQVSYPPTDLRLPVGNVDIKPLNLRVFNNTSGSVMLQINVDSHTEASLTVSFRLLRKAPMVVATRDLLPGSIVGEEDVKLEDRFVQPGPLVLSDVSLALGQQVALPVKGGTPVTSSALRPAFVVRRGMRVKLICKGPAFTVTSIGEALQDAVAGQTVRVRNSTSLLEVMGVARSTQLVEIPF